MPDPFTAEERDTIIVHVREKRPSTYLSSTASSAPALDQAR